MKQYIRKWGLAMAPDLYGTMELSIILTETDEIIYPSSNVKVITIGDGDELYVKARELRKATPKAISVWENYRKEIENN